MANHRFMVWRQDGIGPHPDSHPCASCGQPKSASVHQTPPALVCQSCGEPAQYLDLNSSDRYCRDCIIRGTDAED